MTLTAEQATDAAMTAISTIWAASSVTSGIPLRFGDVRFDKGGESPQGSTDPEPYARVVAQPTLSIQTTQGRHRWQTTDVVTIQTFTPPGDGWLLADQIRDAVLNGLRSIMGQPDGLSWIDTSHTRVGTVGAHVQMDINASYFYFERLAS